MTARDELQKVTLNLRLGDWAKIQELFPDIGASAVIRRLVTNYVTQMEEKDKMPKAEVQL